MSHNNSPLPSAREKFPGLGKLKFREQQKRHTPGLGPVLQFPISSIRPQNLRICNQCTEELHIRLHPQIESVNEILTYIFYCSAETRRGSTQVCLYTYLSETKQSVSSIWFRTGWTRITQSQMHSLLSSLTLRCGSNRHCRTVLLGRGIRIFLTFTGYLLMFQTGNNVHGKDKVEGG